MTTLIFVRHALSEDNVLGLCSGQSNTSLSERGFEQARLLGAFLKQSEYPIEAIYASDLIRTSQTAQPTADALGLPIETDPRLREVCTGEWEGRYWDDVQAESPEMYLAWLNITVGINDPIPKGAEHHNVVLERVLAALDQIVSENRGKCVLIVCHARMLRILTEKFWCVQNESVREILAKRPEQGFHSASVTVVEYDDDGRFSEMLLCDYRDFLNENSKAARE